LNIGNPAAEQQLREIIAAYKSLKTSQQRAAYNNYLAKHEQYWMSIGRRKKRRFAQPAVAGLASGGGVALTVWASLALWNRQEKSELWEGSRVAPGISRLPSQQIDVAGNRSSRRERDGSREPVEIRSAPSPHPTGDQQHLTQSGGNLYSPVDQAPLPSLAAEKSDQVRASTDVTAIWDFDEHSSNAPLSEERSRLGMLVDAAEDVVALRDPSIGANGGATERAAQLSAQPAELSVAKEESEASSGG